MKRFLIIAGVAVALLIILAGVVRFVMNKQEKSLSPEEQISYHQDNLQIQVFYNRPSRKGRAVFGELVPLGKYGALVQMRQTRNTLTSHLKGTHAKRAIFFGTFLGKTWTLNSILIWSGVLYGCEANRDPTRCAALSVHAVQSDRD